MKSIFNFRGMFVFMFMFVVGVFLEAIFWATFKPAFGRQIILITYHAQEKRARLIETILIKKIGLPSLLIKTKWELRPCQTALDTIIQFCVDDSGEMKIPTYNKEVILETLSVFNQGPGI